MIYLYILLIYPSVGTNIRKPSIEYTKEDIDKVWNTNFHSMFALTTSCHPFLKRKEGELFSSVVHIGSVAGVTCIKSGTPYASGKAAMNQLTGNWACEWGPDGIRVNCVTVSSSPVFDIICGCAEENRTIVLTFPQINALTAMVHQHGTGQTSIEKEEIS